MFPPNFFSIQVQESTVPQSGSASIDTMGAQQQYGHLACFCMTWSVETSPLSKMKKSFGVDCTSGGEYLPVCTAYCDFSNKTCIAAACCIQTFINIMQSLIPLPLFSDCQQLIKWCLSIRPSDRPTLEQIFEHPWMRPAEVSKTEENDIRLRTIDTDTSSTNSSKESL